MRKLVVYGIFEIEPANPNSVNYTCTYQILGYISHYGLPFICLEVCRDGAINFEVTSQLFSVGVGVN